MERAVPDLTRLPRRPGPNATRINCRCGVCLGEVDGEWLFVYFKRRDQISHLPAEIRCDKCGHHTRVPLHAA